VEYMEYIEAICGPRIYYVPFSGIDVVMSGDYLGNGECCYERKVYTREFCSKGYLSDGILTARIKPIIYADPEGNCDIEGINSDLIFENSDFRVIFIEKYDIDADFKDEWWAKVKFSNFHITKFELVFDQGYIVELKKRYSNCIKKEKDKKVYNENGVIYHVYKDYLEVYCGLLKLIIYKKFLS